MSGKVLMLIKEISYFSYSAINESDDQLHMYLLIQSPDISLLQERLDFLYLNIMGHYYRFLYFNIVGMI